MNEKQKVSCFNYFAPLTLNFEPGAAALAPTRYATALPLPITGIFGAPHPRIRRHLLLSAPRYATGLRAICDSFCSEYFCGHFREKKRHQTKSVSERKVVFGQNQHQSNRNLRLAAVGASHHYSSAPGDQIQAQGTPGTKVIVQGIQRR